MNIIATVLLNVLRASRNAPQLVKAPHITPTAHQREQQAPRQLLAVNQDMGGISIVMAMVSHANEWACPSIF